MTDELIAKLNDIPGVRARSEDVSALKKALPWIRDDLIEMIVRYPLANACLLLSREQDESGLGVEMRWLFPQEIIDEATNFYPGIAAAHCHYLPIGECLLGTGDPYFVNSDAADLVVLRVPHDAVNNDDTLDESRVERVSASLEAFLQHSIVRR